MKRTILFFSFLYSCILSHAQEGGLLWKISGNELKSPSYLFGTYHGTFDILYNFTDSVPFFWEAFDAVECYVGESDSYSLGEGEDMEKLMASFPPNTFLLPQDTTYSDLLSSEELQILDDILFQYLGVTSENIPFAPTFLSLIIHESKQMKELTERNLSPEEITQIREQVMDLKLLQEASDRGYEVGGLENHLEVMEKLLQVDDLEKSAKELVKGLQIESPEVIKQLSAAYRSLRMESIEEYGKDLDKFILELMTQEEYEEMIGFLLTERNLSWMEKIPVFMQAKPTMFGVGVRHLPGSDGLINLLRKAGFTVEPI